MQSADLNVRLLTNVPIAVQPDEIHAHRFAGPIDFGAIPNIQCLLRLTLRFGQRGMEYPRIRLHSIGLLRGRDGIKVMLQPAHPQLSMLDFLEAVGNQV